MDVATQQAVDSARKTLRLRGLLLVVAIFASVWALRAYWDRLEYFFGGGELQDIGDVRELRAKGVKELPAKPGSYVRLRNLIVSRAELGTKKYNFFFCPIYRVLVRTPRPLPEGSIRVAQAEIPEGLEYLVEQRKVWPEDFALHFDAEGWLLTLQKVPGWDKGIREWVKNELKLTDEEIENSFALLDGETPGSQYWALLVLIAAIVAMVGGSATFVLAMQRLKRLQAQLGQELSSEA